MVDPVSAQAAPLHSVIDLGTLGGSSSRALAVNNAGVVVGAARTSEGSEHAFVWNPVTRRMRDLGTLGVVAGRDYSFRSEATGINDHGQIVGNSCSEEWPASCMAFLWEPRTRQLQPLLRPGASTFARAINNHGVVVGDLDLTVAAWWTRAQGWQLINDPSRDADGYASATDINDRGQIVGLGSPEIPGPDSGETEPFVFSLASQRSGFIAPSGCCGNGPVAVNQRGQAVANGFGFDSPPFVWNTRTGRVTPMAQPAQAADINANGLVVGTLAPDAAGMTSAFWWHPASGLLKELKSLGGSATAAAVNNRGWVVGSAARAGAPEHAVVWRLHLPRHWPRR